MTREPLNIGLAIAAVLLLATGGAWLVDHARHARLVTLGARCRPPGSAGRRAARDAGRVGHDVREVRLTHHEPPARHAGRALVRRGPAVEPGLGGL